MNTAPLLTMRVDLPTPKYPAAVERIAFYRQLLERLTATPGVWIRRSPKPGGFLGSLPACSVFSR
jgi:hypothetical protein